jgi:hypothetical protein
MLSNEQLQLIFLALKMILATLVELEETDGDAYQLIDVMEYENVEEQELENSIIDQVATAIAGTREFLLTMSEQLMYLASPVHFKREKNRGYWTIVYPNLRDDYSPQSYYAHYRMKSAAFEELVNHLSEHPAFQLAAHKATPTYIQVACVFWRYANCHARCCKIHNDHYIIINYL